MADTLYFGGHILTMEPHTPQVEALLVSDGIITATGSRAALMLQKKPDTHLVDLAGRALLPAFIDSHSHITALAQTLRLADLSGCTDMDGIIETLHAFMQRKQLKPGDWVVGFGYDHNTLREHAHPTCAVLDRVSSDTPVLITHASGHMGAANSCALKLAGIDAGTAAPPGGKIGRSPGTNEPDGYLEETAFQMASAAVPAPTMDELCALLDEAQDVYLSYGITTAQDGVTDASGMALLDEAAQRRRLRLDVVAYADVAKCAGLPGQYPDYASGYHNRLRLGGYKLFLDGSPQGRTAWLSQPYEGAADGYCGYPKYTDEQAASYIRTSVDAGRQLLCHCNGDAAAEQFLRLYGQCAGSSALRPVMIHAQLVRVAQLDTLRALGMIPSFFVAHVYHWGDTHLQNLGHARAAAISPLRAAAVRGIPFTLHQDTPVIPPDMLETVWCAACRVTKAGATLGKDQCVSTEQALRGVTANAAYQYFEEHRKGTLRAGKPADLVLLDRNPLAVPPEDIRSIRVLETVKEGRTLYQAP